ncbi:MAG: tripartite tricarboxylate transporter substrate-binding protein, partial [Vicinamibacterales bacterium]
VVRSKTPPEVVAKLSTIVQDFTNDPATVSYLASIGSAPMPMDPKRFRNFVESETRKWAEIVKAGNIEKQ